MDWLEESRIVRDTFDRYFITFGSYGLAEQAEKHAAAALSMMSKDGFNLDIIRLEARIAFRFAITTLPVAVRREHSKF